MGVRHGTGSGSGPVNAAACRDVAFDTVIMVKQTPRRMLAAVQEVCGGRVLVPDETAREAAKVYVRVATGQARRETQWMATDRWGADWSGEQRETVKRHTLERTREKVAGFRRWLDEEVGLYGRGEETLDGRLATVAYGVCRPDEARDKDPRTRWRILSGFAAHFEAGRMPETAKAIARCQNRWRGRTGKLMESLEHTAPRVQGTRESERRRIARERAGSETAG